MGLPSQPDGVTPLRHAVDKGYADMAGLLADAETSTSRSPAPRIDQALLGAATAGNADAAALALRSGARLETRDARGRTPLLLAVTHGHLPVARLLVALGANPDALEDRAGVPARRHAITRGQDAVAEILRRAR